MIRYALRCECGHTFESWFQSSSAYETQHRRHLVTCPACESAKVEKAIMAPRLASKGTKAAPAPEPAATPDTPAATSPLAMAPEVQELVTKLRELREHVEKNAENVGRRFPNEARKIHYGDSEHRAIYGQATAEETRSLLDEGVEVMPLPLLPDERN
ncbi:DUF1178 family protein [Afipia sp. 1NLS2]|jgi:hypothetical protein|uniref:DUF1178 family protein n=1 Tax=Afipia sp. 1NLS2 TaxID=666684 RepID=UPI0001DA0497|nr:DUF1178 family protein [Afipia sp. 1NLS2]EFI53183.1 protein of unknown function DUF1178 [Afipia sp. 1NLS2]MBE0703643.1 DUF1178 family protein [Afipia sp.]